MAFSRCPPISVAPVAARATIVVIIATVYRALPTAIVVAISVSVSATAAPLSIAVSLAVSALFIDNAVRVEPTARLGWLSHVRTARPGQSAVVPRFIPPISVPVLALVIVPLAAGAVVTSCRTW